MASLLMIWTARAAVGFYLGGVCATAARSGRRPGRGACILRTTGCALLWAHILLAFEAVHGWSVDAAYRHTAAQTAAVTGWNRGEGLYVNFAVAALWLIDAGVLWRCRARGVAPARFWTWGVQAALGFVVLNATVVFGPRGWWWVAAGFVGALIGTLRARKPRDAGAAVPSTAE
jgi:hypothetical protein